MLVHGLLRGAPIAVWRGRFHVESFWLRVQWFGFREFDFWFGVEGFGIGLEGVRGSWYPGRSLAKSPVLAFSPRRPGIAIGIRDEHFVIPRKALWGFVPFTWGALSNLVYRR